MKLPLPLLKGCYFRDVFLSLDLLGHHFRRSDYGMNVRYIKTDKRWIAKEKKSERRTKKKKTNNNNSSSTSQTVLCLVY